MVCHRVLPPDNQVENINELTPNMTIVKFPHTSMGPVGGKTPI